MVFNGPAEIDNATTNLCEPKPEKDNQQLKNVFHTKMYNVQGKFR